jgi:hypothetical protein
MLLNYVASTFSLTVPTVYLFGILNIFHPCWTISKMWTVQHYQLHNLTSSKLLLKLANCYWSVLHACRRCNSVRRMSNWRQFILHVYVCMRVFGVLRWHCYAASYFLCVVNVCNRPQRCRRTNFSINCIRYERWKPGLKHVLYGKVRYLYVDCSFLETSCGPKLTLRFHRGREFTCLTHRLIVFRSSLTFMKLLPGGNIETLNAVIFSQCYQL